MSLRNAVAAACLAMLAAASAAAAEFKTHPGPDLSTAPEIQAKKPLLIYYVGDVAPSFSSPFLHGVDRIVAALDTAGENLNPDERFLQRVGRFIRQDLEFLNGITDIELAILRARACHGGSPSPIAVAILRNTGHPPYITGPLEAYGTWEYWDPNRRDGASPQGGTYKVEYPIVSPLPIVHDPYWSCQMTNHPAVFRWTFDSLRRTFPDDQYRYHLYIKGRGDAEHVLKARYLFDTSRLAAAGPERAKLREAFLKRRGDFGPGSADEPWAFEMRPEHSVLVEEILSDVLPRRETDTLGITKRDLLEFLAERGGGDPRRGAFFSTVVLDTTSAPLELSRELKPFVTPDDYTGLQIANIGRLHHFQHGQFPKFPVQRIFEFGGIKSLPPGERDFDKRWNALLENLAKESSPK